MASLEIQDVFDPYYQGRDNGTEEKPKSPLEIRRLKARRSERLAWERIDKPATRDLPRDS